jgi:hypothetical protein
MNAFTKALQTLLLLQEKRGGGSTEPVMLGGRTAGRLPASSGINLAPPQSCGYFEPFNMEA